MHPRTEASRRAWEFLIEHREATTAMIAVAGRLHNMQAYRIEERERERQWRKRHPDRDPSEFPPRDPSQTHRAIVWGRRRWAEDWAYQLLKRGRVRRETRDAIWWILEEE